MIITQKWRVYVYVVLLEIFCIRILEVTIASIDFKEKDQISKWEKFARKKSLKDDNFEQLNL